MGKQCYICRKSLGFGRIEYGYYVMRRVPTPDGMTADDATCNDCYNKIKDENKEETKETQSQVHQLTADLFKRTPDYKKHWDKNGIIQFKNERIAILKRSWGTQVEFIIAYDDLTAEGYELKAIDEGKSIDGQGISGGVNSYYYFQKQGYSKN